MTTYERLEGLLDEKDEELEALRAEVETLRDAQDDKNWRWARHGDLDEKQVLPVPRLEIWLDERQSDDDYHSMWVYRMVYRHFQGHCVAVPLGSTKQSGSRSGMKNIGKGKEMLQHMPFRDGVHIRHEARTFGWPMFMVAGDEVVEISQNV